MGRLWPQRSCFASAHVCRAIFAARCLCTATHVPRPRPTPHADRIGQGFNPEIRPIANFLSRMQERAAAVQEEARKQRRPIVDIQEVMKLVDEDEDDIVVEEGEVRARVLVLRDGYSRKGQRAGAERRGARWRRFAGRRR